MWKEVCLAFNAAIVLVLLAAGCSTVPVTGRTQFNIVSADQEMELGLASFDQLKKELPISRDPAINDLVQTVGKRIAAVAQKDMPEAQWEFVVFESEEANAFCLPGGKVGIYTGILKITRDEAGLATVIGHEVAHATARHGAERMSEALVKQTGGQLLGVAVSGADPRWQQTALLAYGVGTTVVRELPHSRRQELEADRIGLMYMARAGYDPRAALDFWTRFSDYMAEMGAGGSGWLQRFLSTHPVDEVRIKELKRHLPEAEAEFSRSPIR
ncbi:MAG TPA: M48 family metallopeptidase [Verrucomicrobia bacterium]|nr:M48 family metallopeptidase [Verrucomicrobiota bacterium]HOP98477.1 M48 family metallopeptidase [Verrucomicrobiota bacterium]HPU56578.1 M48 family metallopeptidase [Verrucomicrobiota bacterium]